MAIESASVTCPYCGEEFELEVEVHDEEQEFIEDCRVCCHPIEFHATMTEEGLDLVATRSS